jgi:CubicO group peptidase (beta-lactamase class C family)
MSTLGDRARRPARGGLHVQHGLTILGVLVARVTGRSFPEYLAARILGLLGITETGLFSRPAPRTRGRRATAVATMGAGAARWPDGRASLSAFPSDAGARTSTAVERAGRFRWIGGTGTSAYVVPSDDSIAVLLTQVQLGGSDGARLERSDRVAAAQFGHDR